ncbi:MAG: glucose-1-phosphate thymidylyltransferase [Muribaculaceae bacterium]|nr:glucose-1-phosphate thymidylyltransferase [Muribaculaceae bacterium]
MSQFVLFDPDGNYADLLPLSFTRPLSDFRVGVLTLRQKWEKRLTGTFCYEPVEYLTDKYGQCDYEAPDQTFILGSLLADDDLAKSVSVLKPGEALLKDGAVLAYRGRKADLDANLHETATEYPGEVRIIKFPFDIFLNNFDEIVNDFKLLTAGRKSAPVSKTNTILLPKGKKLSELLFVEEGADVECAVLDLREGPVYIGRDATIMPGVVARGPLALCEHAVLKVGAKIYGGTTFGPYCKIGGEVSNTVIFGYSNKAHDGYLGNAVIGEWCNLGAGVNSSNLKNDYSKIRIWNYPRHTFMRTDLQFCGLIMGDHSKAGINVMFNTATVVGVGCNLHGAGFPRVFVPSFSAGSPTAGLTDVSLKKFYEVAERVMSRRGIYLTDGDRRIYERVYEVASKYK